MRHVLSILNSESSLYLVEKLAKKLDLRFRAVGTLLVVDHHADGYTLLDQEQSADNIQVSPKDYVLHGRSVSA